MAIAGPSSLGSLPSLALRHTRTCTRTRTVATGGPSSAHLRHFTRSSFVAKPLSLSTETSSISYGPSLSESIAAPSSLSQQRARQRISEIDSQRIPPSPSNVLRDRHARQHTYLRISLTEKCNLRCLYCMPEDGVPLTPSDKLLSAAEVERLAALFVSQGVNKIRLTGGEPTVRSDLPQIVSSLAALKHHGLEQIGITTNGIALGRRKLDTLVQNGLTHLNVSLDTLDPFKFEFMTRRRGHEAVLDCIERALALGVQNVKINVVVIKGLNDTKDVVDFVRFTKDKPITIRFIEYMPFDGNKWQVQKLVPYRDLVETIRSEYPDFERVANHDDPNDTSKHWRVPGHQGTIGFITSMTDNFCGTCNRLRITADGNLKVCLFGNAEVSLRDAMRTGFGPMPSLSSGSDGEPATDEQLLQLIAAAVGRKHAKHAGMRDPTELAKSLNRPMITIGGLSTPHSTARWRTRHRLGTTGAKVGSLTPRRSFHASAGRKQKSSKHEEEDNDQDDDPWGSLDKAFENLEDKSLYRQVYLNRPSDASTASSPLAPDSHPSKTGSDPIAEMEEAIFAQAGAAAVQASSKPSRNASRAPLSGVKFSTTPPLAGMGPSPTTSTGAGSKWSEYMHEASSEEDDSPWSSLDAFVDNPESSAQFAVPLQHLQNQHQVMQQSVEQAGYPQQHHPVVDAFAANDNLLRQQMHLRSQSISEEEAIFARAGADAVASILNSPLAPSGLSMAKGAADEEDSTVLSHVDASTGGASMVDVGHKVSTARSATAVGRVYLPTHAAALVRSTESSSHGVSGKGPVLHTAQLAGIMAAKRTADLIPLCHPLALTHVQVQLSIVDGLEQEGEADESWVSVECTARTAGQTGVEMEALTGCTVACLTVWDMVKAVAGKTMRMGDIMVVKKSGGKSGDWQRTA